jgi:ribosomal protein S18 acetylase RimI-like enzyme
MAFTTIQRRPTPGEYNTLRQLANWPIFKIELIEQALKNSLFSVVIEDEAAKVVGMGRVVGDNAIYLHIQDVIVHPDFQRQGVGKIIMNELMDYVQSVGGPNTNIGLMCSKGREAFYKEFGFIERPNEKFGSGMIKIMK